jgi:hypothetical protein
MSLVGWYAAGEIAVHHQLRAGDYDPHGLVVDPKSARPMTALLDRSRETMALAEQGDLTAFFERFAKTYEWLVHERLFELGRVRDVEAILPCKIVAPPDALDARIVEIVSRLREVGAAAIAEALGAEVPAMRTLQRRLGKLVSEGTLGRRGSRKTAVYLAAE